ncbi:FAD-binding oxidoreductase [Solemya elarraichensis gill symbiont]|uniref:FAD-binding oxidoreductase n=1 Tax=Solemya elarraichensis gill symbiont TaxID=1918949 RepID=UPI003522F58A
MNILTGNSPLLPDFLERLCEIAGSDNVLSEAGQTWAYGYDNSRRQAQPGAVVHVHNADQVEKIVRLCHETGVAITARGKGTGTTGATVPLAHALVISFERMNRIIEIDTANRLARVEPGVTNGELQAALKPLGFFWPPDPTSAAVCTIGGNLAYNSAGPRAVKYGTPRENSLGLKAVSGSGEVFATGCNTTKGVVGYDLTRLLIGSEGTLAIITEATLKLTPLPEAKCTMQATYRDIESAAQAVAAIMAQPVIPCALEFMDGTAIKMVRKHADLGLDESVGALLMIEVDGTEKSITEAAEAVAAAARSGHCLSVDIAQSDEEVQKLWKTRKALSPALRTIAPKKINEDVVVPVSSIPQLIGGLEKLSADHDIMIVNFGHAGNGNIHVNLLVNPDDKEEMKRAHTCLDAVFDLVLTLGGTLSGEHGVGLEKRDFIDREIDPVALRLMHDIKKQFDPANILNPGKTIPPLESDSG